MTVSAGASGALPAPARAGHLDEVAEALRALKAATGDPSYDAITDRVNTAWTAAGRAPRQLTRRSTVAGTVARW